MAGVGVEAAVEGVVAPESGDLDDGRLGDRAGVGKYLDVGTGLGGWWRFVPLTARVTVSVLLTIFRTYICSESTSMVCPGDMPVTEVRVMSVSSVSKSSSREPSAVDSRVQYPH